MARPSKPAAYLPLPVLLLFSVAKSPGVSSFLAIPSGRNSPLSPRSYRPEILSASRTEAPRYSSTVVWSSTIIGMTSNDNVDADSASTGTGAPTRTKRDTSSAAVKARRLYSWTDARRKARTYGFTSRQEFVDYECAGSYQLPKNADEVWADEFTDWEDFLGVPPRNLEEARAVARTMARDMGVRTEEAYLEMKKEGGDAISEDDAASRLPLRPDLYYKADWISWDDFLGI